MLAVPITSEVAMDAGHTPATRLLDLGPGPPSNLSNPFLTRWVVLDWLEQTVSEHRAICVCVCF